MRSEQIKLPQCLKLSILGKKTQQKTFYLFFFFFLFSHRLGHSLHNLHEITFSGEIK